MTDGLFKKLSLEQQSAALAFDGNPDFGPPRTDLTKALSELRRLKLGDEIDAEFGSTILDAARTGDLLPRADADLAELATLRAQVERLTGALTIAANRLHRCSVDYDTGTREFIEVGEWADEARAAIRTRDQ